MPGGLLEVDEGEVLYDGRNFSNMTIDQRKEIRKEMGMFVSGGALFDSMMWPKTWPSHC
jgi:phospholipid/cholesterol/gamma-HCH transport system ATP-binding protein